MGDISVSAMVVGATLDVVPIGPGRTAAADAAHGARRRAEGVLELAVEPTGLRDLLAGAPGAIAVKGPPPGVSILDGGSALLERFRLTFRIEPVGPPTRPGRRREAGDAASVA